ncbi:hypothetical protein ABK040_002053 [Willaertia magna]
MVSNTRRNDDNMQSSSQSSSQSGSQNNNFRPNQGLHQGVQQYPLQGFTFRPTQSSSSNVNNTSTSNQIPGFSSSQSLSHNTVQGGNNNSSSSTTVLGEGESNDYLQHPSNVSATSVPQQNSSHQGLTLNSGVPVSGNNNQMGNNLRSSGNDMIYNRPSYNPNPRSNTGFQFAINNNSNNNSYSNSQAQSVGPVQDSNPTSGDLLNLFRSNSANELNNNNSGEENKTADLRINNVVAEECLYMGMELVAFGYNKEEVEAMNISDLFFYYSKMHSQLHLVYNNEGAFQKRIESLLSKYHHCLNLDELAHFTSDSCQQITSEVIKYDFQIYNYLGRLGVYLVNSSDLVERQELQELMVLLIALRRLSLKFGAKNNNMNLSLELISSYLKSDTLESALSKKLSELSKKHKEGKIMETLVNINKSKPNVNNYLNNNKRGVLNSSKNSIGKSNKMSKQKSYSNSKHNSGNNNNTIKKTSKFPNNPSNSNSEQ